MGRDALPLVGAIGASALWSVLVAWSPSSFFIAAAPLCAIWMAVSMAAAPPGLSERLEPEPGEVALGVGAALLLYAGTHLFLRASCGGLTDALCGPLHETFARFQTRTLGAALVLGLLVAPAEELFWRGVVQARLAARLRAPAAIAVTTGLAAAVALATGEGFLALATAPTYAVWGVLFAWRKSLVAPIVSHAIWSVLVAWAAPPV
jgi:uncharacterized protein